jgi:peptidoglycan hydrolase-like protein with peptidoglycan-binding domain
MNTLHRFLIGASVSAVALAAAIIPAVSQADVLTRNLSMGSTGADVSSLQTFLAKDATLYPQGLVTGYFGFLTKSAVSNFQSRNGIDAVGIVGPITRPVLNIQMAGGVSTSDDAALISNVSAYPSRTSASISWNTNEATKGTVYYSTSPLMMTEYTNSVQISGTSVMTDSNLRYSQNISFSNLQPNTVYYYSVYSVNQVGNASLTWPATFQTGN